MNYDAASIDTWVAEILREGKKPCRYSEEYVDPFEPDMYVFQSVCANRFVKIERGDNPPFYAYYQPCFDKEAPLVVHTPGYGAEMSFHPEIAQYYNVLHISPLGYNTPRGKDRSKLTMNGCGPVYPETIVSGGKKGYACWLADCVSAVEWARRQKNVLPDRISFFGTSQGGGGALLLASLYREEGVVRAVAAEEPFLTDFKTAAGRGAYAMGADMYADTPQEIKESGEFFVDTTHHVHRISCPVLLTSGGRDGTCPPETVKNLFESLKGTKSYTHFDYLPHGYSREFLALVKAWFMMYA